MKKLILAIVGFIFVLSSCTTESNEVFTSNVVENDSELVMETSNQENLKTLKHELLLLNQRTFGDLSHNNQPQTRFSFGKLFKKIFNFVVADAGGAIKGLVNGDNVWTTAKTASLSAVGPIFKTVGDELLNAPSANNDSITRKKLATDLINPEELVLKDVVPINPDSENLDLDSIGYYHNKIILTLFKEKDDALYWENLPVKQIEEEVQNALAKEPIFERLSLDTLTVNKHEMLDFYGKLSDALNTTDEPLVLCDKISDINPEMADLLSILSVYVEGIENVKPGEDWTNYTNEMLDIVNRSKVDELMKRNIRSSLIVAFASSRLWKH